MSIQAVGAVLKHSQAAKGARLAAIAIGNYADDSGTGFPSIKRIRLDANIESKRTVQAALEKLEELGELEVLVPHDSKTHRPCLYWLKLPGLDGEIEPEHPYFEAYGWDLLPGAKTAPAPGADSDPPPGAEIAPGRGKKGGEAGAKNDTALYREPSVNRQLPVSKSSRDSSDQEIPEGVLAPLQHVAEAKDAKLDPPSVRRALEAYPDRDWVEEAEKFASWHLEKVPAAKIKSIATGFRKWLKTAEPKQTNVRQLTPPPPPVDVAEFEGGHDQLLEVWPWVCNDLIPKPIPISKFKLWLDPIVPVGIKQGSDTKVLVEAPAEICSWSERRFSGLLCEVLARYLGAEVDLVWTIGENREAA